MGFYSNTLTLAFNSDCSRAVLSASGKINECPSSNKKVFDTHTPHRSKRMKKKKRKEKKCLKPVGGVQPLKTQTWLFAKVQVEDGSFHTYSNHDKHQFQHALLNSDTAFPSPHILPRSQFPSTFLLKRLMLFPPLPCLSTAKVCYHEQGRITAPRELLLNEHHWNLHPSMDKQVYEWPTSELEHWMENQDTSQEIPARFCYYLWQWR